MLRSRKACLWCWSLAAVFAIGVRAHTQELEISVSPSPVGSGARAAGMADAFVAVADDATAASWNPAGLVQLERPEIAVAGAYNGVLEEFSAWDHDEVDSRHYGDNIDLNFLSVTYPLPFLVAGRNVSTGLYYHHKYDFTRRFTLRYTRSTVNPFGTVRTGIQRLDFEQRGGLSVVSPALSVELTHRVSLGVEWNLWRSTFLADSGWEQHTRRRLESLAAGHVDYVVTRSTERYRDFRGDSYTLGLLWSVSDRWNLGARYDSAFTGAADYSLSATRIDLDLTAGVRGDLPLNLQPRRMRERRQIRFPATLALGAAYRANDRLTVSCDITRTDWNDFYYVTASGERFSLVNAASLDTMRDTPRFDPTHTLRLGTEYVFIPRHLEETLPRVWSLRAGVFLDQEPASERPDTFYGVAAGVGLLANQRVNIDLAYQLRYGRGVNEDFVRGIRGFEEDVLQNRVLLSTVVYF